MRYRQVALTVDAYLVVSPTVWYGLVGELRTHVTIGTQTRPVVLIGNPVEHSFSPLIHNTTYELQGVDAVYLATPVIADELANAVQGLKSLGALGANVTIPYKQKVLALMDELSEEARTVGAINTITIHRKADGTTRLRGDNTDVAGFLSPLMKLQGTIRDGHVVIFGAGGAARAVLFGVLSWLSPAKVTIVARNLDRAKTLIAAFATVAGASEVGFESFDTARQSVEHARLIVNTTPLGMHPREATTPWPEQGAFGPQQIVYDLVYNPPFTQLLRDASSKGARTINGIEMLLGQAAASHTLWTGLQMPVDDVRDVLLKAIDTTGTAA